MPISFHCPQCGKSYTTSDETAGKRARCKQCGNTMMIPRPAALDPYALSEPSAPPQRGFDDEDEVLPRRPTYRTEKKRSSGDSGGSGKAIGGVVSVLGVLGIIAVRIVLRLAFSQIGGKAHRAPEPPPLPPAALAANANADGPIALPAFPDPGPGHPIAPGVDFHEIRLPGGPQPGFGGKLWLYLPSGAQPDKSLPCVLITGAGSNLMVGMDLGDGDRAEHLPYVHAGFAVLAFELDGAVPNMQAATDAQIIAAAHRFLAARAGLVNAHIALEYALAKVPQVNPNRLYVAGHSSAGTLALLFAEHEPRLKGCVAFAPAIDVAQRLNAAIPLLQQNGLSDLVGRYSPKTGEGNLACPLFLFHAQDDSNVPVSSSIAWAQRLQHLGKNVTLETVPRGEHYDSMIQQGIPRAIAWLQGQGQPGAGPIAAPPPSGPAPVPIPGPAPTSPPNAGGFPAPPPGAGAFPP
ncbi:MAG: prolyl oligopeptidase family serine peptidase, partial [Isosphaeraceae bacterium]|nr:prolyl oligopeptidase family serine peptidase [Isosphaeraceae bacterium]